MLRVTLPDAVGGTSCLVELHPRDDQPPVVLVHDGPHNPGPSVQLVFEQVSDAVRGLLALAGPEPVWVVRWRDAAVARLLLHDDPTTTCDQLATRTPDGWAWSPIPAATTRALATGDRHP